MHLKHTFSYEQYVSFFFSSLYLKCILLKKSCITYVFSITKRINKEERKLKKEKRKLRGLTCYMDLPAPSILFPAAGQTWGGIGLLPFLFKTFLLLSLQITKYQGTYRINHKNIIYERIFYVLDCSVNIKPKIIEKKSQIQGFQVGLVGGYWENSA